MLDIKEEQKYEQLKKLGQELHIPIFEAFFELEVRNKDGKTIQKHEQRSHSFVRNIFNGLFSVIAGKNPNTPSPFGAGRLNFRHPDGTVAPRETAWSLEAPDSVGFGYRGALGAHSQGIQVGSGTTAESFEDFALAALIPNGAAAGQLNYIEGSPNVATYDSATRTFTNTLARFMNNNSGGSINVNEVGLTARVSFGGFHVFILAARDLLPTTVIVPNTGQLRVTYTISLAYPA